MTKFRLIFNLGFTKEAVSSFIPTSLAYIDIFKKIFKQNEAIALAVLTFLVLFIILIFVKVREYQRSVSRALANGYFESFISKLVDLCSSKGKNSIKFSFADDVKEFTPDKISIRIFLKDLQSDLRKKNVEIGNIASIAYVDTTAYNYPFFVWAKTENDRLIIYDVPRTLLSLKNFVDPNSESEEALDKETKPFYRKFNSEFRKLWISKLRKDGLDVELV